MALGYLGKNYLWAASPLMNQESTGSTSYNTSYAQRAADAFGELLSLCESGQADYSLVPFEDYYLNFYTTGQNWQMPGSTEAIFRGPYYGAHGSTYGTAKQYQPAPILVDGDVKFLPTANYVDFYGMANGLPIENITEADPESGYDPEYPWRDRDPRFYNDIVYDGVRTVQGSMPDGEEYNRYANLFTGGSYRNERTGSRTGYMLYKFIPMTANKYDEGYGYGNNLNIHLPYMRLADVYLMYAEALNEQGRASEAIPLVNRIRERANLTALTSLSQNAMMEEIRHQRMVEFFREGLRFYDLKRWGLIQQEMDDSDKVGKEFIRVGGYIDTRR